ncbi:COG4223 family protein [Limibacillus halophilus]|uniref:Inner membrane protein n=1 Tax=Limibacillus halophilus TaxID=1579333 RepID=A0A839SNS4_9PROT|nr:mitofilin family membrane protein [Limibacillus halophilus]MBB3064102.1 hypothetical protein [Limibacillus halophilus]
MDHKDSGKTAAALEVIEAFGGIRPMAQKLGVAASTVQGWKERLAIPEARHELIRKIVAEEGISLAPEVLTASAHPPAADSAGPAESDAKASSYAGSSDTASVAWTGADDEAAAIAEADVADNIAERPEAAAAGTKPSAPHGNGFSFSAFVLGALAVLVIVGITVMARGLWLPAIDGSVGNDRSLDRFEARISKLEALPSLATDLAKLEAEVGVAKAAANAAREEAARALAESSGGVSESNLQALDARLAERLQVELSKVSARLDRIESHQVVRPVSTDDLILTLSLGRLREAILLGDAFKSLLDSARSAAASNRPAVSLELAALEPFAVTGVPRIVTLQRSFEDTSQAIVAAAAGEGESDGLLAGIKRRLARVVTVRPLSAEATGDGTAARVARAEKALEGGNLAGAVTQIEGLEGLSAEAALPWLEEAKRRLEAEMRLAAATEVFLAELSSAPANN